MMGRMTEEDMVKDYKALLNAYGDESDIAKYLELQDELVARDAAQRATIQQLEAATDRDVDRMDRAASTIESLNAECNSLTVKLMASEQHIQQLEVLVKGLEAELEEYRSIAEREGAEIAVSQLSQEQAKVKQLEARVKVLEKQLSERLEDGTKILSES